VFTAPPTNKRESFEFSVSIGCDSHEYKITKTYDSIPRVSLLTQKKIALYDPVGKTRKILDQNNVQYHLVDTLTAPPEYDLFIIGYHALQKSDTHTVGAPQSLFFQGNVLCFEQETLSPFGLTVTDHSSSIAFIRTPVFTLDEADLQFWQPDNIVSRHDIAKPTSGNYTPVVDSGGSGGLEYTALLQYKGNTLFCQLLVTEKYDSDPGAHVLFWGLIDYAATMEWQPKTLGLRGDSELLDSLDVYYEKTDTFEYDVLFVTEMVSPELLKDFVSGGGIAWLHGLEPDYLQKIDVNTQEILYGELPVLVIEDALMYGLSSQEFYWEGEREGWYTPLTPDIATYSISHQDGIILTDPCIFLKIPYGKGFFLVDTLQWEYNKPKSFRIVSALLTNLGVPVRTAGVTLEAEAMVIEEVTLGERADNYYGFYTNGYLGSPVTFLDSGVYTIRVFAWADVANHEGALLQVLIDRNPVGILEVTGLGVYEIECYVERGVHEVGIAFTNDYWDPPEEDRNLYIDKIEISFGTHSPRSWIMC
jgi:hypothetical protein